MWKIREYSPINRVGRFVVLPLPCLPDRTLTSLVGNDVCRSQNSLLDCPLLRLELPTSIFHKAFGRIVLRGYFTSIRNHKLDYFNRRTAWLVRGDRLIQMGHTAVASFYTLGKSERFLTQTYSFYMPRETQQPRKRKRFGLSSFCEPGGLTSGAHQNLQIQARTR